MHFYIQSEYRVGTLCAQLLQSFYAEYFETCALSWSGDVHVFFYIILRLIFVTFFQDVNFLAFNAINVLSMSIIMIHVIVSAL